MSRADATDLSGAWLVHPADADLARRFFEREFDDADWAKAAVPGHWRSCPELADSDGPVLYRHPFDMAPPAEGRRAFLVFDGIFYFADVWLDGAYLGATEGYFFPQVFEITEPARAASEHVVAAEVACPKQTERSRKRLVTGVFSHWDCLDPEWNPGGLWRPVRVVETGPVRIDTLRAVCAEATEERGRLRLTMALDATPGEGKGPQEARLVARLTGPGLELEWERHQPLAAGENRLEWVLEVDRPPRWWPRRLGDQPLCDLEVAVEIGGETSDVRRLRTGFREVRLVDWAFHLNGERLYVMGSNQGPARQALAEATPDELRRDVELAAEANLDMLRVHAHVSRPDLYAAADEAGLLLWQDFPLQWGYARGIRREAARQARALVDLLGHHPSIVLWCGHNEPLTFEGLEPGRAPSTGALLKAGASMFGPTWNKNLLDRSVHRALAKTDGTRPVDPHSGVLPGPMTGGTDAHLYFGWYHGHMAELAWGLRRWPRLARFVSEFGAQAVPETDEFMEAERWPDLDWERLGRRHNLQRAVFERFVPPDEFQTFGAWREATQEYQAALVQLQVEDLRRVKYRPGGGFLHFCLADGHPAVTWSVLDHQRMPKRAYAALRDACRPVLPVLDPRTGDVHVASELRQPLTGATVEAEVGERRWRWAGDVAADAVTFVGRVTLPPAAPTEPARVRLDHPDVGTVTNDYATLLLAKAFERRA